MTSESANRGQNLNEQVKELAEQGHGRNSIARKLKVNTYQVDKAAEHAGVKFDRKRTREAVESLILDATLEREQLSIQFREVSRIILGRVLNGTEMDTTELKDLIWAAGSASASDARYGKLSVDQHAQAVVEAQDSDAADNFAELLHTIRGGFQTLDETPMEELEDPDDADDEPP